MDQLEELKTLAKKVVAKNKELATQLEEEKKQHAVEIEKLSEEVKMYKDDAHDKEEWLRENSSLRIENERMVESLNTLGVELEEAIKKANTKDKELEFQHSDNVTLENKLKFLTDEHERAEGAIIKLSKMVKELREQIAEKDSYTAKLLDENVNLNNSLADTVIERDSLIKQITELTTVDITPETFSAILEQKAAITSVPADKIDPSLVTTYRLGTTTEKVKDKFVSFVKELYREAKQDNEKDWILNNLYESSNNVRISEKDRDVIIKRLMQLRKNSKPILIVDDRGTCYSSLTREEFIEFITEKE